jgi:hypothetical protein
MRLRKLREDATRNVETMKYFCLTPTYASFCKVTRDKNLTEECFNAWKVAAIYKYAVSGLSEDDNATSDNDTSDTTQWSTIPDNILEEATGAFMKVDEMLSLAIKAPTRTLCDMLLCVFYATGELKYIDIFYQCMGIIYSQETKKYLSDCFKKTRADYNQKIYELECADKNHFEKYNVDLSKVDFSYFDETNIAKFRQIVKDRKLTIAN